MPASTPTLQSSSIIGRALNHSCQMQRRLARAERAEQAARRNLKQLLIPRLERYSSLFKGFVEPSYYFSSYSTACSAKSSLHSAEVKGERLKLAYHVPCGDGWDYFEIEIPVRYLGDDWEQAMDADLAALRAQHEARGQEAARAQEARDREQLQALLAKYPDANPTA